MKNKKGFTLVELLAVIAILGLIMIIAVPSSLSTSSKVKEKMLKTKMELANKAAILWAQDNRVCFSGTTCTGVTCTGNTCEVTLEYLAEENYLEYDDTENPTNKKIINPTNKVDIKTTILTITHNSNNTFSVSNPLLD